MDLQLPPLCIELTYPEDSAALFERIQHLPWPVLLDSANTSPDTGRYDIFSADPFIQVEAWGQTTRITDNSGSRDSEEDPFLLIERLLADYQVPASSLPFAGGALGYFAYDLGRRLEHLPQIASDAEHIPDMAVGIYDWAVVVDHQLQRCYLASFGLKHINAQRLRQLAELLQQPARYQAGAFVVTSPIRSNLDENQYAAAFSRIQHYITEGDCYQVNLAKRFEVDAKGDGWTAYKQLRQRNAAPFSAFFAHDAVTIMSSSPERLLQVRHGQVETKPIKGTRPRDKTNPEHDQQLAQELQSSPKDRAENLMIVDLLRNDIGKVCRPGSIRVPAPFALESFASVHHLVSTITGELNENQSALSLLRACFPGGSITGAPKLRAMEIIEELEPNRRGVYCGGIGYIGFDGNMDMNITIRTLVYSKQRLRFWAGGGIVKDSDMAAEHQEVFDKAAVIFQLVKDLQQ